MSKKILSQLTSPTSLVLLALLAGLFVYSLYSLSPGEQGNMSGITAKKAHAQSNDQTASRTATETENKSTPAGKAVANSNSQNSDGQGGQLEIPESDMKPKIDIEKALSERSIGADDAPIVIHEYSSLSCGHCATFHNQTLGKLKEKYIDTGKVKLVFHEFPLNRPALFASMLSRCLPEKQYYNFIQLLFETQESWAYVSDFDVRLKQNAKMAGISEQEIEKCLSDALYLEAMVEQVKTAQEEHNIRSTPTFIFEDSDLVLSGARSFEDFRKAIEQQLDQ